MAPLRYDVEVLPGDLRETALIHAAEEALRAAVGQLDVESGRDVAGPAWRAEPVVRFLCSAYHGDIAGVRVSEESFVVVTARSLRGTSRRRSAAEATGVPREAVGNVRGSQLLALSFDQV